MPNTFNLNTSETTYISADVDDRKRVSVGREGAFIKGDEDYKKFDPEKPVEIDSPITVVGPGHFTVEHLDAEPSAPSVKLINPDKDDVQEPSSVAKKATKRKKK